MLEKTVINAKLKKNAALVKKAIEYREISKEIENLQTKLKGIKDYFLTKCDSNCTGGFEIPEENILIAKIDATYRDSFDFKTCYEENPKLETVLNKYKKTSVVKAYVKFYI